MLVIALSHGWMDISSHNLDLLQYFYQKAWGVPTGPARSCPHKIVSVDPMPADDRVDDCSGDRLDGQPGEDEAMIRAGNQSSPPRIIALNHRAKPNTIRAQEIVDAHG